MAIFCLVAAFMTERRWLRLPLIAMFWMYAHAAVRPSLPMETETQEKFKLRHYRAAREGFRTLPQAASMEPKLCVLPPHKAGPFRGA